MNSRMQLFEKNRNTYCVNRCTLIRAPAFSTSLQKHRAFRLYYFFTFGSKAVMAAIPVAGYSANLINPHPRTEFGGY